jgi:hypothetical protein
MALSKSSISKLAGLYETLMSAATPQQTSLWDGWQGGQQAPVPYAYPLMPQQTNLPQAQAAMNLSPQEQAFYMRHITNLYGPGGVDNAPTPEEPSGSRSTVYASVEPHNGRFSIVPTVWDGQIQTQRWQRPSDGKQFDIPNSTALKNVEQAGWGTFPSYSNPQEAESRYLNLHQYMDRDVADYARDVKR